MRNIVATAVLAAGLTTATFALAASPGEGTPDNPPVPPQSGVQPPASAERSGVITPPATGDTINNGVPPVSEFPTPIVPPPGTRGGKQDVVPK